MRRRAPAADRSPPPRRLRRIDWVHLAATTGLGLLCLRDQRATHILLFLVAFGLMLGVLWVRFVGTRRRDPRVRIRKEGFAFSVLTIAFGLAATNTSSNMLYLTTAAMLAFLVLSGVLSSLTFLRLGAVQRPLEVAQVGETSTLLCELRNRKPLFSSYCIRLQRGPEPRDQPWRIGQALALRVAPKGEVRLSLAVEPSRRGRQPAPACIVSSRFPFAFIEKWLEVEPGPDVLVLPALGRLSGSGRLSGKSAEPMAARGASQRGESLFRGVREYRFGDHPRLVHWKSSARLGEIRIKEFEHGQSGRALVVLTTLGADPAVAADAEAVELAVSYAGTLIEALVDEGLVVDLITDDPEVPPVRDIEAARERRDWLSALATYDVARTALEPLRRALHATAVLDQRRVEQTWVELDATPEIHALTAPWAGLVQHVSVRRGDLEGRFEMRGDTGGRSSDVPSSTF